MNTLINANIAQVPPRDNVDRVPLGASSASMYPGYSPADHIYGEAAAEYGQVVAESRRLGKEIGRDPSGLEYIVGQSQLSAKEQIEEIRRKREEAKKLERKDETSGRVGSQREQEAVDVDPMEGVEQLPDGSQLFVIDSNPTPLELLQSRSAPAPALKDKNKANNKVKRRVSFQDEQHNPNLEITSPNPHKTKKAKLDGGTSPTVITSKPLVEENDISDEVDARLKAKEEKRKSKKEKKRKRDSGSSELIDETATAAEPAIEAPTEKAHERNSNKKKQKKDEAVGEEAGVQATAITNEKLSKEEKRKRQSTESELNEVKDDRGREKRKKKRRKETAAEVENSSGIVPV